MVATCVSGSGLLLVAVDDVPRLVGDVFAHVCGLVRRVPADVNGLVRGVLRDVRGLAGCVTRDVRRLVRAVGSPLLRLPRILSRKPTEISFHRIRKPYAPGSGIVLAVAAGRKGAAAQARSVAASVRASSACWPSMSRSGRRRPSQPGTHQAPRASKTRTAGARTNSRGGEKNRDGQADPELLHDRVAVQDEAPEGRSSSARPRRSPGRCVRARRHRLPWRRVLAPGTVMVLSRNTVVHRQAEQDANI